MPSDELDGVAAFAAAAPAVDASASATGCAFHAEITGTVKARDMGTPPADTADGGAAVRAGLGQGGGIDHVGRYPAATGGMGAVPAAVGRQGELADASTEACFAVRVEMGEQQGQGDVTTAAARGEEGLVGHGAVGEGA